MRNSRILFASPHCVLDFSSGAAIATLDMLEMLAGIGYRCQAFGASKLDLPDETSFEQSLTDSAVPFAVEAFPARGQVFPVVNARKGLLPITIFRTRTTLVGNWMP